MPTINAAWHATRPWRADRRQPLVRAEDDACAEDDDINSPRGRRMQTGGRLLQRAEDDAMRTTIGFSRRQVGATRRAGSFLAVSRAFVSSGVPERSLGGRGGVGSPDEFRPKSGQKRGTGDATGPNYAVRMEKRLAGGLVGGRVEML